MGRSVSTPNQTVSQAFVNVCQMGYEWDEESESYGDEFDQDLCYMAWEDFKMDIVDRAQARWKSLIDVSKDNKWAGREDLVLLENDFAQIGVSEYCGCANIWLRHKGEDYDCYYLDNLRKANMAENWCNTIHENFMKEFAEYVQVGRFSNGEAVYQQAS